MSVSNTSLIVANSTYTTNTSNQHLAYGNDSNKEGYEEESQLVIPMPTSLRQNTTYISVYVTWMYFVFMFALPFGCLSVLNLLIYLDVRKVETSTNRIICSVSVTLRYLKGQ